jgi:hypothetical protein
MRDAMRNAMRLKIWLALLCTLLLLLPLLPAPAFAQYLGQVTLATVQAQLASNVSCTGNAQNFLTSAGIANFNNLGQTQHQVSATSAAVSFVVEIDGIDVLGNVVRISSPTIAYQPTNLITGYVAQGNGYYPNIQVSVTCTLGATFSMTYSGSTGGGTTITATPGVTPTILQPGIATDVQGMVPTGTNGQPIFPVIEGALDPAVNAAVRANGIDTFSGITFSNPGTTGNVTLANPPQPSQPAGEYAVAFYGPIVSLGATGTNAPWTVISGGGSCISNTTALCTATLSNFTTKNGLVQNYVSGQANQIAVIFVAFQKAPTLSNQNISSGASQTVALTVANTGDTILVGFHCNPASGTVCGVTSVTDTFGSTFKTLPVSGVGTSASGNLPLTAYVATANGSGADTITVTQTVSTARGIQAIDFSNVTPANINSPSAPVFESNFAAQTNEDDNGVLFAGNGSFDYTQTAVLAAGTTTFPLWAQSQNGIFYACTVGLRVTAASGTTPTLDTYFQDSPDNVGFNDRMHFPQATAAANYLGAVSGGVGGITPVATTDGTMAVSTKLDGPLSAFGRIKFVVAGTTPSFTVTYNVACR